MSPEPDPPEELCVKLRTAADRLLAGTPLHSSGKLTILDLAEEAQVKRWLLTHKYPNKLMAKYQAEFKAARHKSAPVKKAEAELDKLREQLARGPQGEAAADGAGGHLRGHDRATGEGAGRGPG